MRAPESRITVGAVDTNVGRLLARLGGRPLTRSEAQSAADRLVPSGRAWLWNQALFDRRRQSRLHAPSTREPSRPELGRRLCQGAIGLGDIPVCGDCPLQQNCAWCGDGPDPADGSAGVSASQPPFEGSDRQCRGRLVEAHGLRSGPQPASAAARLMGLEDDPPRAHRILGSLRRDGLVVERDGSLELPAG